MHRALLIFLLTFVTVWAAAQSPLFHNYETKDGLPSPETYRVLQDSRGYIWIATDAGLSRFNGYEFRNFTTSNGLPDNVVFVLCEDTKGRLWGGTFSGKFFYVFNDTIHTITLSKSFQKTFGTMLLSTIYVDKGDTIWVGGNSEMHLLKIYPDGKKKEEYTYETLEQEGSTIFQVDGKGVIYGCHHAPSSYLLLERVHDPAIKVEADLPRDKDKQYCARTVDGDYIFSINDLLFHIDAKGKLLETRRMPHAVLWIYIDSKRTLWVGTNKTGVFHFNGESISDEVPRNYLTGESVSSIVQDHEGGTWFTTLTHGVFYLPSELFYSYRYNNTDENFNSIISIGNTVLASTYEGNIYRFSASGSYIDKQELPEKARFLSGIYRHSSGDVVIAAHPHLLITDSLSRNVRFGNEAPYYFTEDSSGRMWAGASRGFYYMEASDLAHVVKIQCNLRTTAIYADKKTNVLWVGSVLGFYRIPIPDLDAGKLYIPPDPLITKRVNDIQPYGDALLVATQDAGFYIYRNGTFRPVTARDGLPGNNCRSIYVDRDDVVWVGTDKGLARCRGLDSSKPDIYSITTAHGLLSDDINKVMRCGDKIWVASRKGITFFDPRQLQVNTAPARVYITSVEINDKSVPIHAHYDLSYDKNFLTLRFSGLAFVNAGNVTYRYKLEGIDEEWRYTRSTQARYTTLPPGDYTFTVYARNSDGTWSSDPAKISFFIDHPYWAKWWFITSVILISIGIAISVFMIWFRQYSLRQAERIAFNKKLADTELLALRAQMNPHFVFNSLNSIQLFILNHDSKKAQHYLSKFSRLMRSVLQNSKQQMISLEKEIQTLELYIELESLRFEFEYKIEVDEKIDMFGMEIPSMLVQPYVENAIWHGLMHKEADRKLLLKVERDERGLVFTIRDNGIGRKKAMEQRAATRNPADKSMGMTVTNERIEVMNSLTKARVTVNVIDLYNDSGEPEGTCVELIIPVTEEE